MKMNIKCSILVLSALVLFSCSTESNKTSQKSNDFSNYNSIIKSNKVSEKTKDSSFIEKKTRLIDLFNIKVDNSHLNAGVLQNVDIVNGFRSVKLGLSINTVTYNEWDINSELEKYGFLELKSRRTVSISNFGEARVNLKLYKGKIYEISFFINDNQFAYSLYSAFIKTYGEPNFRDGKPYKKKVFVDTSNEDDWTEVHTEISKSEREWRAQKNSIIHNTTYYYEGYDQLHYDIIIFKINQIDDIESKIKNKIKNEIENQKTKKSMNEI